MVEMLSKETIESQVASGAAFIGTPDDISEQIAQYIAGMGGFESASLQVNFNTVSYEHAAHSVRLFSEKVIPRFARPE
jgi:alkanesulfonate monooxygenase SsuD/methylene tetrahydromethanopterin reductase-like flavin-dependent oxidoreductase (luciferase family)